MSKKKSSEGLGKALDLWEAPEDAGEPLICVATTFTFDASFFETECVGRFLHMQTHPSESESVGYLIEREEKLAAAQVCALVDRRHAREKESLRWDVLGILVPKAIQHAKVALLVWGNCVRVAVGSGNLTEPGYRRNLEVFGKIDISREFGGDVRAVVRTIEFLETVLTLAVGDDAPNTPRRRATDALVAARRHISGWVQSPTSKRTPTPVFGLPGEGVLSQLEALWPSAAPSRVAHVLSPFFDTPPGDRVALQALLPHLAKKRPRDLHFYVRAESQPDGTKRVYAPLGMLKTARQSCDVSVFEVSAVQTDELRALHAKMLWLENDEWILLLAGSSNFTGAGLAAPRGYGSCEANLVYRLKASDSDRKSLDQVWPDVENDELGLDDPNLLWDPVPEELEGGGDDLPLPACFQDAIYIPGSEPVLAVSLAAELPESWSVRNADGSTLLGSGLETGPGRHLIPWANRPVPFVLHVLWQLEGGTAAASWPVNVSNPSGLPPPDALRDLTLEELLEILSSTRPLHDAVVRVIEKRVKGKRVDIELDPLKRHDSPAFLLRRTKRVAIALERLRDRLERPALSRDSFEYRLNGAVGPMALADAFVRDAEVTGEAKFYLAELALTLQRVKVTAPAAGGLAVDAVREMIAAAIASTQSRASGLPVEEHTAMIDAYAAAAFAEAIG